MVRNYVEERLKNEPTEEEPTEEVSRGIFEGCCCFPSWSSLPLEKDQADKEIALLEKMYSDLKIKQDE